MKVQVTFFAHLKKYAPDGAAKVEVELDDNATLGILLDKFSIPQEVLFNALINGRREDPKTLLKDRDTIVIMVPVSGG